MCKFELFWFAVFRQNVTYFQTLNLNATFLNNRQQIIKIMSLRDINCKIDIFFIGCKLQYS